MVGAASLVAIAKCNVNRQSRILKHINADGPGIEIGPCHSPVATKRKGFNVEIIDHLDREGLIKKYSGQRINTDNIEEVDHVWHGQTYAAEYYLNVVRCEGEDAWDSRKSGSLAFSHPPDAGQINYSRAKEAGEWLDVHAWCFVPHAFRLLIQDLYDLGLIQLKELSFHPAVGCEFYMTLSREGEGMPLNRMSALQEMELEITGQSAGKPSNRLKKLIKKGLRVFS